MPPYAPSRLGGYKRARSGRVIGRMGRSGRSSRNRIPSTKLTGLSTVVPNQSYITSRRQQKLVVQMDNAASNCAGNLTFKLSDLPAYTDFTNLFDQYRVLRLTYQFFPRTGTQSDTTQPGFFPAITLLTTAIDTSGDAAVPALTDLLEYASVEQKLLDRSHTISFVPRTKDADDMLMPAGTFVSTDQPNQVYNSLRYFTPSNPASKYIEWECYCEALIEFKNSK